MLNFGMSTWCFCIILSHSYGKGKLGVDFVLPLSQEEQDPESHQNLPKGSKLQVWNFPHGLNMTEEELWWKMTFDGRRILWKTTFDGRQSFKEDNFWMEDHLQWNTTFDRRWPLMEDDVWWKTTFNGRCPLMEDTLWRKKTFDWRWPSMKDDLWWKMSFDGRWPLTEDELRRKITMLEDDLW